MFKSCYSCYSCNSIISKSNSIYYGFDHTFCSSICRNKCSNLIYKKDPRLFYPTEWKNLKPVNKVEESTSHSSLIKKNKSYKDNISILVNEESCNIKEDLTDISCNIIVSIFEKYFNINLLANRTYNDLTNFYLSNFN